MVKRRFIPILFFLFFLFISLYPQTNLSDQIKDVEAFIKNQMEVEKIPGIALGIMKGEFIWAKGFGFSDLENKIPMKENSSFRLASVTKPMTATAILQLAEKGKINLNDEVQKYVPYFPRKNYPVIIRYLLGHLGGITHYKSYDELHIKLPKDTREAIEIFANYDLVAEPGTVYHYSSYGYNLLGAVIEGASKTSYGKYMEENIWKPLGMTNTCMDSQEEIIPNRVKGYRIVEGEIKNSEFVDMSSRFAGGGTRSTVVDLLKFVKGLKDGKIISKGALEKMFTSMTTKEGEITNYGYGWFVRPLNGHFFVYHTGSQQETRTFLGYLPEKDIVVSFACNLEGVNPSLYGLRVIQIILGEPVNINPYTGDPFDDLILNSMTLVFNYGMSYFERYGKALTENKKEMEDSFSFFKKVTDREFISKNPAKARKELLEGIHPKVGEPFQKLGSFMAQKLKNRFGEKGFDYYHKNGAITFFSDYINLEREEGSFPPEYKFSKEFENKVKSWEPDWLKTLNDSTRTLFIGAFSEPEGFKKNLWKNFSGAKIYPDFSSQIWEAVRILYLNGKYDKAIEMAKISKELYPQSSLSLVSLANAYLASGDLKSAKSLYEEAFKAKVHREAVESSAIIRYAEDFANFKMIDKGIDLINLILDLSNSRSELNEEIGKLLIGKAKNYFERALKEDPTNESARKLLKKIKDMEREMDF